MIVYYSTDDVTRLLAVRDSEHEATAGFLRARIHELEVQLRAANAEKTGQSYEAQVKAYSDPEFLAFKIAENEEWERWYAELGNPNRATPEELYEEDPDADRHATPEELEESEYAVDAWGAE